MLRYLLYLLFDINDEVSPDGQLAPLDGARLGGAAAGQAHGRRTEGEDEREDDDREQKPDDKASGLLP